MKAPAWLRPSSLPRLARCPASGVQSEGMPNYGSDAAARGTAFHEVAAVALSGLTPNLEKIAAEFAVSVETLREWLPALDAIPRDVVHQVEREVEAHVAGVSISGRADLVTLHDDWVEVTDFKTGNPDFADPQQELQLMCYGLGVAQAEAVETIRLSECYVQLGTQGWRSRDVTAPECTATLEPIVARVLEQAQREPERRQYRTGDHCTFCPARATCPARTVELRSFFAVEKVEPAMLTAENIGAFDARLRAVEKLVEAAKDARKEFVREHGGRVVLGDGYVLELCTEHRGEYVVKAGEREVLRRVRGAS